MKKVIITASHHYTSPFQIGSHHYARAFEKLGFNVLYISYPLSIFHYFYPKDDVLIKERKRIYKVNGEKIGNIFYYVPFALLTPNKNILLSSKVLLKFWHKLTYPNLLYFISSKGFDNVDIIWFDSYVFGFLLEHIIHKQSILRIADNAAGFNHTYKNYLLEEKYLSRKVNKVVVTSKLLYKKYSKIIDKSKLLYIPNGIDLDFFYNSDKSFPNEYKDIPPPRVVYLGAMSYWFDVELLSYCAQMLPEHNFVLVGKVDCDVTKIKKYKNVFILGVKPYNRIYQFLANAHVGIIPFDVKKYPELVNCIDPIKVYEYLACKLPVVSVKWAQIEELKDYIILCETKEEFVNAIKNAKQKKINLTSLTWKSKLKSILYNYKT